MKDENKYMRFDHAAANVEAVPFVDEKIYTVRDKEQLIASALSSRDTEIREVLEGLITCTVDEGSGPRLHWCPIGEDSYMECGPSCEAARALYAKLQVKESGNDNDNE